MKLLTKLTLTSTLSKVLIAVLFVLLLPLLVRNVAFQSTDRLLKQQTAKVFDNIRANGIEYYLQGEGSYGSYTLLREEYISLERTDSIFFQDTIFTEQRVIEDDTLQYRIYFQAFQFNGDYYVLEIGKALSTIEQYNAPLQRIALYVLSALIILTLLFDFLLTSILLRPLSQIISTRILHASFPFNEVAEPVKTSTIDFRYLDGSLTALMQRINEDIEREKQFTSNASHELMTPVGILQSKLENLLLLHDLDEEVQMKTIEMMRTVGRLKKIVNALLLISRIENRQYARTDTVSLAQMIGEMADDLKEKMQEHQISLTIDLKKRSRLKDVNGDLLFQLFFNIIHNAIRYNKPGGSISITDLRTPDGGLAISVRDTGAGISHHDLHTIFERFSKKMPHHAEGHGLGLAIVKSIADLHDIEIEVDSEPGKGSVFVVKFSAALLSEDQVLPDMKH
ncbi:MAG TPA: HAMP domain-containing sensor histidine kinase [Phnomibacter sp.]|nr:HAMP domain-containing sensor histidine kinase [Phnomibacter sp.]